MTWSDRLGTALVRDERGTTLVEFAMIAPVMTVLLLGGMDIAHTLYMTSMTQGIVQKTARDGTLEGGQLDARQTVLDGLVRTEIAKLNNQAVVQISRQFFTTYEQAQRRYEPFTDMPEGGANGRYTYGEVFTDSNGDGEWNTGEPYEDTLSEPNGACNNGEAYTDENGNGTWKANLGRDGQGGAKDAVIYSVRVTYPSVFPFYAFVGGSESKTVTATTVLRNQPYGDQEAFATPQTRYCT